MPMRVQITTLSQFTHDPRDTQFNFFGTWPSIAFSAYVLKIVDSVLTNLNDKTVKVIV